ncbi:Uncharacterized HTH-type transcriptional regulator Rv1985c/MT2039 [Actinomyces howellii]|uniref:Uncharacterized HTH-type transcriptional regulator Rv1985c/MT2039 n=2 Tax=Actinomyces howellii TaxID=52771 RepID=A0A3S4R4S1_9ACTO|nr:Uncharacterized HTH-type transcriptional regulator Rv1985c/MT2039 [Actinomyces howellii]
MNPDQLAALEAIADTGTFEAAGARLGVSTSAVSQRIRALESALGRVLVRRGAPSTPTRSGQVVLRYARQQHLLAAELAAELDLSDDGAAGPDPVELTTAVNADTLSTWYRGVLRRAVDWPTRLRVVVANESRTAELLRSGTVMSAVSSSSTRVAGCRVEPLGALRYEPVVARTLLAGRTDPADPAGLPALRFDADDDLQDLALRRAGLTPGPPRAVVPTATGFVSAIEAGLGWGMLPAGELAAHPGLTRVPGLGHLDWRLYWHRWSISSPLLDRLTTAVREAAAEVLIRE